MDNRFSLSYYYGKEAEQFSFYKIPKLLFTEDYYRSISVEAKVLYGLMLDRMSLSVKNQWLDSEGRAYIYFSLEDIMESLGCSNKKAITIMKELDAETGIGLIERKKQGQGKPTIIYVKQFVIREVQTCKNYTSGKNGGISEVKNLHVLKCKNDTSRSEKNTCLDVKFLHTNKNNINNTDLSNTESNPILSDHDEMGSDVESYAASLKNQLELDLMKARYPYQTDLLDGIFDIVLETILSKNEYIVIASNRYPASLVRAKLEKLNSAHIEYALECLGSNTKKIHNIKKYILATLFNAPSTMDGYYQAEVNHDMSQFAISGSR